MNKNVILGVLFVLNICMAVFICRQSARYSDVSLQDPLHPRDFVQYLTGAAIVKSGNVRNLYDYQVQKHYQSLFLEGMDGLLSFRTPVTTAYLYSLLPLRNPIASFWITVGLNFFFVYFSLYLITKDIMKTLAIGLVIPVTVPIWMTLVGGHINGFLLFLLCTAYLLLKERRSFLAGFAASFLFLKPNFLLFVPFLALLAGSKKEIVRFLSSFLLSMFLLLVLNSLLYGVDFVSVYFPFLFQTEDKLHGTDIANNVNFAAVVFMFYKWLGKGYSSNVSIIILGLLNAIFLGVLFIRRSRYGHHELFSIICLLMPVLNLHTMHTDLISTVVPLALVFPQFYGKKETPFVVLLFILVSLFPWTSLNNFEWLITIALFCVSLFLIFDLGSGSKGSDKAIL